MQPKQGWTPFVLNGSHSLFRACPTCYRTLLSQWPIHWPVPLPHSYTLGVGGDFLADIFIETGHTMAGNPALRSFFGSEPGATSFKRASHADKPPEPHDHLAFIVYSWLVFITDTRVGCCRTSYEFLSRTNSLDMNKLVIRFSKGPSFPSLSLIDSYVSRFATHDCETLA